MAILWLMTALSLVGWLIVNLDTAGWFLVILTALTSALAIDSPGVCRTLSRHTP